MTEHTYIYIVKKNWVVGEGKQFVRNCPKEQAAGNAFVFSCDTDRWIGGMPNNRYQTRLRFAPSTMNLTNSNTDDDVDDLS